MERVRVGQKSESELARRRRSAKDPSVIIIVVIMVILLLRRCPAEAGRVVRLGDRDDGKHLFLNAFFEQ